ncbi:MAG TPA: hypothetical protein VFX22_09240 [Candidatus Kapabacteria bacterium]|nr:hypothetical protein [Candidatus Kapabacteria bacterium]
MDHRRTMQNQPYEKDVKNRKYLLPLLDFCIWGAYICIVMLGASIFFSNYATDEGAILSKGMMKMNIKRAQRDRKL